MEKKVALVFMPTSSYFDQEVIEKLEAEGYAVSWHCPAVPLEYARKRKADLIVLVGYPNASDIATSIKEELPECKVLID